MKTSAVAICSLVCSVMLSACGGSSGKPDITFPASTSAATSAPAVTSESSTPPATQSSAHAPRGRDYVDPQGKYTMTLGNTWKATKGPAIAEYWVIGKPDHGIKPSLNITTEDLPAAAQGISPDVYMKVSIKNLKKAGFTVIKSGMIRASTLATSARSNTPRRRARRPSICSPSSI